MAKTEFLQVRLSPVDRQRIERVAAASHLEMSTWARQAILRALDEADSMGGRMSAPTPDSANRTER
jgi:hypothetical protein